MRNNIKHTNTRLQQHTLAGTSSAWFELQINFNINICLLGRWDILCTVSVSNSRDVSTDPPRTMVPVILYYLAGVQSNYRLSNTDFQNGYFLATLYTIQSNLLNLWRAFIFLFNAEDAGDDVNLNKCFAVEHFLPFSLIFAWFWQITSLWFTETKVSEKNQMQRLQADVCCVGGQ